MSVDPTAPTPTSTQKDRATSDPAPLVPTDPTAPVTVREIAEFLHHLTDLRTSGRSDDPAARAAFLHHKAELFTRLAPDPTSPGRPAVPLGRERRTP